MDAAARNLNRHPQYMTQVEDLDAHVIGVIGEGGPNKARLPLLCTQGWAGSTFEFWQANGQVCSRQTLASPIARQTKRR